MPIKHAFTSAKADLADTTKVRPVDWNASHTVQDGTEAAPGIAFTDDPDTGARRPGTNRLTWVTAGADRWEVSASGHLLAVDDNTYDIGASGATRPRDVFVAGRVIVSGAAPATPTANAIYADSIVKGWVQFDGTAGSVVAADELNVSSITDNGTGDYTVNWDLDFANADYSVVATCTTFHAAINSGATLLAGSVQIVTFNSANAAADAARVCVVAVGDQ